MTISTFAAVLRSSTSPLFSALRRLADAPVAAVNATAGQGWPIWDSPRATSGASSWDAATSIDPDGSPA